MKELLIRSKGETPALALVKDRVLIEYWELDEDLAWQAGAIYLGRANRFMKSLKALFVTLGDGVEGFLPFDEMLSPQGVRPGDALLVQIKKPAQGGKSAFLTQDVSLPGRFTMLLPNGKTAHASKRAENKQAMKMLARRLCPENMGLVLRKNAETAPRKALEDEIASQVHLWQRVHEKAAKTSAPALIQSAPGILERLLRDELELPERAVCDDEKLASSLPLPCQIEQDPFSLYGIEQQRYLALKRRVYLPSGGQVVLDPCEAALMIDVNTGKDTGKAGDLALRTNLEAAHEIARLLRLRRVGGMILIDFIDMPTDAHREKVKQALEDALKEDRMSTEVLGFTRLGLIEMTRRRGENALNAQTLTNDAAQEEEHNHA